MYHSSFHKKADVFCSFEGLVKKDAEEFSRSYADTHPEARSEWMIKNNCVRVGTVDLKDDRCQKFLGYVGCLNVDLHKHMTLEGRDPSGKSFIKRLYHSCDRPECNRCFRRWAVKAAGNAEQILKQVAYGYVDADGKKHSGLGVIEHVIDSCPVSEYELPIDRLRAKSLKAVRARGFLGGIQIFHAQRFANVWEAKQKGVPSGWRYAPHFHYVGFVDGGYACRFCHKSKTECWKCGGFEGVTRRLNVTDGHIVKVKGARKTIFGTLYYQLNHASLIRGEVRSHVGSWVGVCSYTKMKLQRGDRKKKYSCPYCNSALVPVKYVGAGEVNGGQWWIDEFEDDYLDERGVPKWVEIEITKRRRSYEN